MCDRIIYSIGAICGDGFMPENPNQGYADRVKLPKSERMCRYQNGTCGSTRNILFLARTRRGLCSS